MVIEVIEEEDRSDSNWTVGDGLSGKVDSDSDDSEIEDSEIDPDRSNEAFCTQDAAGTLASLLGSGQDVNNNPPLQINNRLEASRRACIKLVGTGVSWEGMDEQEAADIDFNQRAHARVSLPPNK